MFSKSKQTNIVFFFAIRWFSRVTSRKKFSIRRLGVFVLHSFDFPTRIEPGNEFVYLNYSTIVLLFSLTFSRFPFFRRCSFFDLCCRIFFHFLAVRQIPLTTLWGFSLCFSDRFSNVPIRRIFYVSSFLRWRIFSIFGRLKTFVLFGVGLIFSFVRISFCLKSKKEDQVVDFFDLR